MSLSQEAIDVLHVVPWRDKAFIDVDTDKHLCIGLPRAAELSATILERMRSAWGKQHAKISVHFVDCKVHLKQQSDTIARAPCSCVLPKATTASEKKAVALADALGIIDYDDLIPQYNLRTHDQFTELTISGLMRVNHDAIQRFVAERNYRLLYRLADKEVAVLVSRENKRKRENEAE